MNTLTELTTPNELRAYFNRVLEEKRSGEDFPIDIEMVYPIIYKRKDYAVKELKKHFEEGIDYQTLRQKAEQDLDDINHGGQNRITYKLSIPCLEYFVARKVKAVFEVYREVFHQVIEQTFKAPQSYPEALRELADTHEKLEQQALQIEAKNKKIEEDKPKVDYHDQVLDSSYGITVTEIAQELDMTAQALNKFLEHKDIQWKKGDKWILRKKYMNQGLTTIRTYVLDSDKPINANQMLWTEMGRKFIHQLIKDENKAVLLPTPQLELF